MFYECDQLKDISALANWNVSNVERMVCMFIGCNQLEDISALANWNVSNVKDMHDMFYNCRYLNVPNDTNKIKTYLRSLPKHSYPKQDHALLLQSLWERIKPLLRPTTKLNGYFKRYTLEETSLDLPPEWQGIELPQWNP